MPPAQPGAPMKRSDYVKQEIARSQCGNGLDDRRSAETRAEENAQAAERAGVEWDPEEPKLPERIGVRAISGFGRGFVVRTPGGDRWATPREYAEAAARYNAWERIIQYWHDTVSDPSDRSTAEKILSDLLSEERGKLKESSL